MSKTPERRRPQDASAGVPGSDAPILIGYDDTTGARHAVEVAAALFAGRRAVVLDVAPLLTAAESVAEMSVVAPNFDEVNTADALTRAEAGAQLARSAGLTAEAQAELDAPTWEGIVEVADEIGAAVIVLGSRGLRGIRVAFEGSVSHDVAEHAGRPVLIVPPPRGAQDASR
jgi:nucleotide-binding universal stress UspA family protein